ncbi:alpha/beta fold hydrolase [Actinoplanes sp. NEAU-A12]|uniref:Alpha/beta fold hydrolase n=1 Tax=Actinoplanes sandaracinus TaxID=3045177 RepID=A0ABT6WRB5_9ACTN|nr:alpha/beta fold hydrolase [Actinoplanes sandaracinus]MDI6102280.1 alpha/beta fold hydrolase [Actinoplanes sandaracinus]
MRRQELIVRWEGPELALVIDSPEQARGDVLLCHGLAGDRSGPGGVFTDLANELTAQGWRVARWDLPGWGDSGGTPETLGFDDLVQSMEEVVRVVAESSPPGRPLCLAGHSVGALVALAAAERVQPRSLVLVSTDLTPGSRIVRPPGGAIRGGAFRLGPAFWQQRRRLDPHAVLSRLRCPVTIIAGAQDKRVTDALALAPPASRLVTVADADHLFVTVRERQCLALELCAALDEVKEHR